MSPLRPWLLLGLLASSTVACRDLPLRAAEAGPYERCDYRDAGQTCGDGRTVCDPNICTMECTVAADCPDSDVGQVVCELRFQGRRCALRCEDESDCPDGQTCHELKRLNGDVTHLCEEG